jgi:positive regulator of sigma E activity
MLKNVFFNLVFLIDLGGSIGLALAAFVRWPWLAQRLELLLYALSCMVVLVLALAFIAARRFERRSRYGVRIGDYGMEHTDWREG